MDESEIHYLTYDPDEIMNELQYAYIDAGGDVLYPGDEKEMLLRAVQSVMVQAFAGVDAALRMATLRYAVGEYLDIYGEKRGCTRMQAQSASARIEITFRATDNVKTIPAGTAVTADGAQMYLLDEDVEQTGYAQTIRAGVTAQTQGSAGNGLFAGRQMQFIVPQEAVESVYCIEDAVGGQEKEDDDTYRERIRNYGLMSMTTGPRQQYESAAMNVTSEVIDARAENLGAGKVGVALLLSSKTGAAAILDNVRKALNADSVRPLTDEVEVYEAEEVAYMLHVLYRTESGSGLASSLHSAVKSYQDWQDGAIGRAFNPDRLMAMLYQAGAIRVTWGGDSHFNGGPVEYTEIGVHQRCKGTISLSATE